MNPKICIFGDSITQGESEKGIDSWATILRQDVINRGFGDGIINLGIGGNTSDDLLARFDKDIEPYPDTNVILIAIGYNDANWLCDEESTQVPFEKFCDNIRQLNLKASRHGTVIFVGLTICIEKMEWIDWLNRRKDRKMEFIRKNDAFIKDFCAENKNPYIFVNDCLLPEDLMDNAHPNQIGHEKLYNRVKSSLQNLGVLT